MDHSKLSVWPQLHAHLMQRILAKDADNIEGRLFESASLWNMPRDPSASVLVILVCGNSFQMHLQVADCSPGYFGQLRVPGDIVCVCDLVSSRLLPAPDGRARPPGRARLTSPRKRARSRLESQRGLVHMSYHFSLLSYYTIPDKTRLYSMTLCSTLFYHVI